MADNISKVSAGVKGKKMAIDPIHRSIDKTQLHRHKAPQNESALVVNQSVPKHLGAVPDNISLTVSAQKLAHAQNNDVGAPLDKEKVVTLKQAINDGEYHINPNELARKIAKLEAQLVGFGAK